MPRIEYLGDKDKAQTLKGTGLKYWAFATHPTATGDVQANVVSHRLQDGTILTANYSTDPYNRKQGVLSVYVPPGGEELVISGFLYLHRYTAADEFKDPAHVVGTFSGRRDLLFTDKDGFKKILPGLNKAVAGLETWTNGTDLVSWNTNVSSLAPWSGIPWGLLIGAGRGGSFGGNGQIYVNGYKVGHVNSQTVYAAKVGKGILALVQNGTAFDTMYTNLKGDYYVFKSYADMALKKTCINKAATKLVILAVVPNDDAPYALTDAANVAVTGSQFTDYWEAMVEFDIVQTGDINDPIDLVETSRVTQYSIAVAQKNPDLFSPTNTTPADSWVNPDEIITDCWYDADGVLQTETVTVTSITSIGDYGYTVNHPYMDVAAVESIGCFLGAATKDATAVHLMRNNYYVPNAVVTSVTMSATVSDSTNPGTGGAVNALLEHTIADNLGKITFSAIADNTEIGTYTQTLFGNLFPFITNTSGDAFFPYAKANKYLFPADTLIFHDRNWYQYQPVIHRIKQDDTNGVLADRYGNKLYYWKEGATQKYAAFEVKPSELDPEILDPFTAVSANTLTKITNAIYTSSDIIGVI